MIIIHTIETSKNGQRIINCSLSNDVWEIRKKFAYRYPNHKILACWVIPFWVHFGALLFPGLIKFTADRERHWFALVSKGRKV